MLIAHERSRNSHAALLERVAQLETALATRITIEQAKGILARALGISPEDAFTVLRNAARDKGTRLRDLADRIVTGPAEAEAVLASAIHESS
jgi:AmiR/NasT family two-component response regulator